MDEITKTVDQIVTSTRSKENNRRRKNKHRVKTLIDQFNEFDLVISTTNEAKGKDWMQIFALGIASRV